MERLLKEAALREAWWKAFREVKTQNPRDIIISSESSLEMKIHGEWVQVLFAKE